jgi:predicted enzyme related to lactoylglutathione lyase
VLAGVPHERRKHVTVSFNALVFDCADAAKLADFWARVLDRTVDEGASSDFATIGTANNAAAGPSWMFVKVPEGKTAKNRVHPDLVADDLDAEVDRIVARGAWKKAEYEEDGARWWTLADPEGNEFDVVAGTG